jgi:hypothetical protein
MFHSGATPVGFLTRRLAVSDIALPQEHGVGYPRIILYLASSSFMWVACPSDAQARLIEVHHCSSSSTSHSFHPSSFMVCIVRMPSLHQLVDVLMSHVRTHLPQVLWIPRVSPRESGHHHHTVAYAHVPQSTGVIRRHGPGVGRCHQPSRQDCAEAHVVSHRWALLLLPTFLRSPYSDQFSPSSACRSPPAGSVFYSIWMSRSGSTSSRASSTPAPVRYVFAAGSTAPADSRAQARRTRRSFSRRGMRSSRLARARASRSRRSRSASSTRK